MPTADVEPTRIDTVSPFADELAGEIEPDRESDVRALRPAAPPSVETLELEAVGGECIDDADDDALARSLRPRHPLTPVVTVALFVSYSAGAATRWLVATAPGVRALARRILCQLRVEWARASERARRGR